MSTEFKENNRVWIDYEKVHIDSKTLSLKIQKRTPGNIIIIAVGRGGWIPARIVSSSLEEDGIANISYSVTAAYRKLGSPEEYTEIVQGLDDKSINNIKNLAKEGSNIWIVEGICHTGRAIETVKKYLENVLFEHGMPTPHIYTSALHWTRYSSSTDSPWRMNINIEPDCFGAKVIMDNKPHVEYPWEYSSLKTYNKNGANDEVKI